MLELEAITMRFGGLTAVDGCGFSVEAGSITGLIGPNGAGKTTLFNVIAGALRPTAGAVRFLGEAITRLSPDARYRRGLVRTFQIPHEFHRLSARENLMLAASGQSGESLAANWLRWGAVRAEEAGLRGRADAVLDSLNLGHVADLPAGGLSGGQKKLLEIGRTMMSDARLVLLDEPAAGVNRTLLRDIEATIRRLNREHGYTFLLIEHDMGMIERLCGHVVCMAEGRLLIEGGFAAVRNDPRVLEAYLGERVPVGVDA
ncbi:ABC transporter ATP-binding protein [Rubrimonas cliftonensis]|nr:ABC transporter ATP-binding protein [Rubrimonas cliftonensis]